MGYNFGFEPKSKFGRDEAQIGAHLSPTDARHVLAEKPTRPPCTGSAPTIADLLYHMSQCALLLHK
jgi:hypothetical protein